MTRKVIFVADPGIDTAFALAWAMLDPHLEVLAIAASPGNVRAEQATRNVHVLVEQIDPPRWPRIGEAPPIEYGVDGTELHGPNGLGGVSFPCAQLHHPHAGDKLIIDFARQYPGEISMVLMGPATVLAHALDREPELSTLLKQIIFVGGSRYAPGNVSAVAEFHVYCDPLSTQQILQSNLPITMIPLDVTRQLLFSPSELFELPNSESRTSQFLSKIAPFAIGATSRIYGIEGVHLKDVTGLIALSQPELIATESKVVDVEIRGDLTRGMTVFDDRWTCERAPNVELATEIDVDLTRRHLKDLLTRAE